MGTSDENSRGLSSAGVTMIVGMGKCDDDDEAALYCNFDEDASRDNSEMSEGIR